MGGYFLFWESYRSGNHPHPPWSIGIIELEGNVRKNHGLQSLTGKVLSHKDLHAVRRSKNQRLPNRMKR